jgi:hypothetical protein
MRHTLSLEPTRSFTHAHPTAALWTAAAFALLAACGGGYGGGGSASGSGCGGAYGSGNCPAPTINMSSPGSTVNRTVQLTASASAMGSATVTRVDFLVDGTIVGTANGAPYTFSWDSTTVSDGSHTLTARVTDSQSRSTTSTAITVNVNNNPAFTVALAAAQIFPAPNSNATGTASLTVKLGTGAVSGKVTLNGVNATAVTINEAFAGSTGGGLITLAANAATAGEWDVAAGALLTADQVTALLQGKLYLVATSAANPAGEIRGQITPTNVSVVFAALAGSQEVPPVAINASGVAAATVDSGANTLTVHVNSTGVNDATAAEVDTAAAGATGPKLFALTKDAVNPGHWSTELATVTAGDIGNFNTGKLYVDVKTPADPNGALRGQLN